MFLALSQFFNHRGIKKWERHRQACLPVGRQVSKTLECGRNRMVWVTLLSIGIKPEKGLEIDELHSASKVSALKLLQPAYLCVWVYSGYRKSLAWVNPPERLHWPIPLMGWTDSFP